MGSTIYHYDAFISHAVEDKISIANELCEKLESAGLTIWYSGRELSAGDSIAETIDDGLQQSRYGIVIFSQNYISKTWTLREFYSLLAKENNGQKVILPVLYDVTPQDLALKDLTMADRFAIKTDKGMDYVVEKLLEAIRESDTSEDGTKGRKALLITIFSFIAICLAYFGYPIIMEETINNGDPSIAFIKDTIQKRIERFQQKIDTQHISQLKASGATLCSLEKIDTLFTTFKNLKAHYRNEYEFSNDYTTIRFKKNVEPALHIDVESLTPSNTYQFTSPYIYLNSKKGLGLPQEASYAFVNTHPVHYTTTRTQTNDDHTYIVNVIYENNIRYIGVNLTFATSREGMKKHQMTLLGFLPKEIYVFEKKDSDWNLAEIR